jgi:RimJ/RimL family protein N-acetyltransferase/ketosteroid isomerase-like protein
MDTVLESERCRLRLPAVEDRDLVWSATRVAGFNDGMQWDPPATLEQIDGFTQRSHDSWQAGTDFSFTVVTREGSAPIGRVGLHYLSPDGTWAVGYWIHPDHWGRGYAPEASRAAIEFAFRELGATRIILPHATWNDASRRVAEKLGFRLVRETPCGFLKNGKPVPERVYVLESPRNKHTVRTYMEAFGRSDHEAVLACLADDVEWIVPGAFHLRGKREFAGEIVNPAFEPNPRIEVSRLVEEGDVVVAEGKVRTQKKDGQVMQLVFCDVFEMHQAKIRKLTSYLHVLPE